MLQLIDMQPGSEVQEPEYIRLLGYPPSHTLTERPAELGLWARQWYTTHGRPWIYARQADSMDLTGEGIVIENTNFLAKRLRDQLAAAQAHGVVLVAVSAGAECETETQRLWQQEKPDEYFFLEMYGSAVVEHLITAAGARLCHWAESSGMTVLPHGSPGYADWDIVDQAKLWELLRRDGPPMIEQIRVLPTGMLAPKKSLLAIFGVTRRLESAPDWRRLVPCQNCSMQRCSYRRLPYVHGPGEVAEAWIEAPKTAGPKPPQRVRYTVNEKALRKWSAERLTLSLLSGGAVEARFRYEGTTCTNLGQPLVYEYRITLSSRERGWRVESAQCAPAPGDTGHQSQCAYLANPEGLHRDIAAEEPLVGRPLEDVFTWDRPYSPSGCYCEAGQRLHKWGLAFEVIHFALAQREQNL